MSIVRCPRNGAERLSRESPVREDAAQPAPVHGLILVHGSTSTDGWAAWRPSTSRVSPHFRLEEEFTGLGSPGDEFPDTSSRTRAPGDEFPETTSAEAPPQTRAQQKLLHRGRVQRKPVERKRVERKRAQRSRSASPPEQRSEDFARHSAARAGADLWSPQVPHGDHNTALGDPGAVWVSPTPTPLILRVRDLRLVERSILSRPRATSSQLGLW